MKLKIIVLAVMAVLCLFLLSGCSLSIKSPEKLMAPPKLTGDYQALQDTFHNTVNGNVDFVTPINGEHKSAFIVDDFNSDGTEDAIVFYSSKEGEETVNIGVFQKKNGEWTYIKKISGAGNSVDCVIIEDLNGDGVKEIAVGWNIFTLSKQLTVYESVIDSGKESFYEIGSAQYNLVTTADVDSDGRNELFYVYLDQNSIVPTASACVSELDSKNNLIIKSKASIDGNISGYSAIYSDTVGGSTIMLVDAFKNEHDMITEVLVWNKEEQKLTAPLFDVETQTTTATWRNTRRSIQDIDSDGHYEIPVGVEIVGSTYVVNGELQDNSIYYTLWSKFSGKKLKAQKYVLYNETESYSFDIPSSWVGKMTVNRLDSQLYFYRWNALSSEHMGNQLFSIVSHTKEAPGIDGYKKLADFNKKSYEYYITPDGTAFGVTDGGIKDGFSITVNNQGGY